jgi:hypothetical protein
VVDLGAQIWGTLMVKNGSSLMYGLPNEVVITIYGNTALTPSRIV